MARAPTKRPARKAPAKRTATKTAVRKPVKRKAAARKTATRKPVKRKTAARKTTARKAPARKTAARKTTARKGPARKTATKKTAARKPAAKRKTAAKAAAPQPEIRRIRTAKGRRPYFFDDPNVDKLLAMLMALTGEVSVIRERLDTHERLAEKKKLPTPRNIEAYNPAEAVDQARVKWRADYIARILRIVTDELESLKRKESDSQYEKIVEEVSR